MSALDEIHAEVARARSKHPRSFNSSHEGYAIILEELDELWDEVKKQSDERSYARMRREAIQVAATAVRFIEEVCEVRMPSASAPKPLPAEPRRRWPCEDWRPEARCPLTNGEGHTCITATKLEALARRNRDA